MPMVRLPARLNLLVGAAAACAAAFLVAAGIAAYRQPAPTPWVIAAGLAIFLTTSLHLTFRLGAQRVHLTWSEAALIVSFAFVPAAWVVLVTPLAILARFAGRQAAVKTVYNVCNYTAASGAAATILILTGFQRPVDSGLELLALGLAGTCSGLITYGAVAAVIATVQDVPLLSTWRASAGLQLGTLAGNITVATAVLGVVPHDISIAACLPIIAYCLHLGYEGRLRGHQERTAGELHAAAIGDVALDLDEPGVAKRAAEQARVLAMADVAEVTLHPTDHSPSMTYRSHRLGQPWTGHAQDAPSLSGQQVADLPIDVGVDRTAGRLRVWLANSATGVALEDGSENALRSLAAHTAAALANARAHAQQTYYASHDALTGLPNRSSLLRRVDEAVTVCSTDPGRRALVLALLDISGYRDIVKALGHDVAERLLSHAAERLERTGNPDETLAHINSDHFAILFSTTDGPARVRDRIQTFLDAISQPVKLDVGKVELSAAAGIVFTSNPGRDGSELLRQAAVALDEARKPPYVGMEFYDPAADLVGSPAAVVLASELDAAVEGEQLELYFQPMVDLGSGVPQAVEAVVRWHHPTRGLLHPSEFGPVLERSRVYAKYIDWLLRRALETRASWGPQDLPISIDIAAQCVLDQGFPDQVSAALLATGLPGDQLVLELSEGAALAATGPLEKVLTTLRELDVKVAVDHFGTGHQSVRGIRHIPATHLKVAAEFVRQLQYDDEARTVVRVAVETGRGYGLQVVALGVRTDEQVAALVAHGCHVGQGGYFATLTAPELLKYLAEAPAEASTSAAVIELAERRPSRRG